VTAANGYDNELYSRLVKVGLIALIDVNKSCYKLALNKKQIKMNYTSENL